jgi:hypothetical protein
MRTTLFWVITQRVVLITYRRFGTSYRSHLQWSRILDYHAASSGNLSSTFLDNLSVPFSSCNFLPTFRNAQSVLASLGDATDRLFRNVSYRYSPRNNTEGRSSQPHIPSPHKTKTRLSK